MSNQVRPPDRSPFWVHDVITAVLNPAFIMGMIYCLVRFLIIVFYRDGFEARLNYILALYVFAAVLVARIAIESGRSLAMMYSGALGLAAWVVIARFAQFTGPLAALSPLINFGLLVLVAYLADRITFDCTLVESDRDSSGEGLLQSLGLVRSAYQGEPKAGNSDASPDQPAKDSQNKRRRKRKHNPGVSVLYFALLALPLFGLGQLTLPVFDNDVRTRAFNCLFGYLFCSMSLLVATSFLGLRRYLSSRGVEVPGTMTATWLTGGVAGVLLLLVACFALPMPGRQFGLFGLPFEIRSSENLTASRWGWGQEGVPQGSPDSAKVQQSTEPGSNGPGSGQGNNSSGSGRGRQPSATSSGQSDQGQASSGSDRGGGNSNSNGPSSSSGQSQSGQSQSNSGSSGSQSNRSTRNTPQSSQSNTSDSPSSRSPSSSGSRPNDSSRNQSSGSQSDQQSASSDSNASRSQSSPDASNAQGEQSRTPASEPSGNTNSRSANRQSPQSNSSQSNSSSSEPQSDGNSESASNSERSERSDSSDPSQNSQESTNQDQSPSPRQQPDGSNRSQSQNRPTDSQTNSQSDRARQPSDANNQQESRSQAEQRSEENETDEKSESNSSESSNSESQSQPSQTWSSLNQFLGWIPFFIKAITIAALAIFVVYYVMTHRDEVRKIFQDLWNWWLQLFGKKPEEVASTPSQTVASQAIRRVRPFSSFANPLQTKNAIPDPQLAQYTFEAIEAWAAERGVKREEEQTAEEFVNQVVQRFPKLKTDAGLFIRDYCQLAYARDLRKNIDRTAIGRIWQYLQAT